MIRTGLLLLSLTCPALALAECGARLQVPGVKQITPWLAVELAQGGQLRESVDVRVSDVHGCPPLALGVDVLAPPDNRSRVSVRAAPNGAEIGSTPGGWQPLLGLMPDASGEVVVVPVVEWSAQGQPLPAGRQEVRLRWRLYPADALMPQSLVEVETSLIAEVPAILAVELIAAGARQPLAGVSTMLDFGEVRSGAERSVDIEVRGNARAQLSIARQWGELRLRDRPDYTIPYTLLLDGRVLPDDGSTWLLDGDGNLARARLGVVLGDVERRAAGVYEDTLTVVVAPE
jgi:hypothetical protein